MVVPILRLSIVFCYLDHPSSSGGFPSSLYDPSVLSGGISHPYGSQQPHIPEGGEEK